MVGAVDKKQLGSDLLKALGGNNGIDTKNLTDKLVNAQKVTDMQPLDNKLKTIANKLEAWGRVRTAMDAFKGDMAKIKNNTDGFKYGVKSSNPDVLGVSVAEGVTLTNPVKHQIAVNALATGQTLSTPALRSNLKLGTGTISITHGKWTGNSFSPNEKMPSISLDINGTNNTLTGIRDAINQKMDALKTKDANAEVITASVVVNNGKQVLILKTPTGESSSLKIDVTEEGGDNTDATGLSALAYNPKTKSMTEQKPATNAEFVFDGLVMKSEKNKIKGVVNGIDIELKGVSRSGTAVGLNGGFDLNRAELAIKAFVDSFNKLIKVIQTETKIVIGADKKEENGVLAGESSLAIMQSQLVDMASQEFTGSSGKKFTLATMGIVTNRKGEMEYMSVKDGRLIIDQKDPDVQSNLKDFIKDNIRDVGSVFTTMQGVTDPQVQLVRSASAKPGTYPIVIQKRPESGYIEGHSISLSKDKPLSVTGGRSAQGMLIGTKINNFDSLVIDDNNREFRVVVNGVTSGVLELTKKRYNTPQELATDIQRAINGSSELTRDSNLVDVTITANNKIQIESRKTGETSSVSIASLSPDVAQAMGLSGLPKSDTGTNDEPATTQATPATIRGATVSASFPLFLNSAQNTFKFSVDGSSQPRSFSLQQPSQGYANITAFATALETAANQHSTDNNISAKISVTVEGGKLVIKSQSTGASSSVSIAGMDTALRASLGLDSVNATYESGDRMVMSQALNTPITFTKSTVKFSMTADYQVPGSSNTDYRHLNDVTLTVPRGGFTSLSDYATELQRAIRAKIASNSWGMVANVSVVGNKLKIQMESHSGVVNGRNPWAVDIRFRNPDSTLSEMGMVSVQGTPAEIETPKTTDKFPALPATVVGAEINTTTTANLNFQNDDMKFTVDGIQTGTFKIPAGDHPNGAKTARLLQDKINEALKAKIDSTTSLAGRDVKVSVRWVQSYTLDSASNKKGRYVIETNSRGANSSIAIDTMSTRVKSALGVTSSTPLAGKNSSTTIDIPAGLSPITMTINGTKISVNPSATTGKNRAGIATYLQGLIRGATNNPDTNMTVTWNNTAKQYIFKTSENGTAKNIAINEVYDTRLRAMLGLSNTDSKIGSPVRFLKVEVDNIDSGNIPMPMGNYTDGNKLATALQQAINADPLLSADGKSVTVTYENNRFKILSNAVGADTRVSVTGGDVQVRQMLGFDEKTPTVYGTAAKSLVTDTAGYLHGQQITPTLTEVRVGFGETGMQVKVDGITSGTLQLPLMISNTQTPSQFARTLQSRINNDPTLQQANKSVTVKWEDNRFKITSNRSGGNSAVEITSMSASLQATLGLSNPTMVQGTALQPPVSATSAKMVSGKLKHTEPATAAKMTLGPLTISDTNPLSITGSGDTIKIKVNNRIVDVQLDKGPFTSIGKLGIMIRNKINSALNSAGHSDRIEAEIIGKDIILTSKSASGNSRLELHNLPTGAGVYGFKLQDGFKSDALKVGQTINKVKQEVEIKSGENQITLSHKGVDIGPATIAAGTYDTGAKLAKAINDALTGKTGGGRSVTVSWNSASNKLVWKLSGTGTDSQLSIKSMPYTLRKKLGMENTPEWAGRAESTMKESWKAPTNLEPFAFAIDGVSTGDLSWGTKNYTSPADMASDLQSKINGVSALSSAGKSVAVTWDSIAGRFNIQSANSGLSSSISITKMDGRMAEKFGFFTPGAVYGKDIEGTINGLKADGEGRNLTLAVKGNDAESVSVNVDDSSTTHFNVLITRGLPNNLEDKAGSMTKADKSSAGAKGITQDDGSITISEKELKQEKGDIDNQKERITERLASLRKRYEHQFNAMHKSLSQLKQSENTIKSFVDSQKPRND